MNRAEAISRLKLLEPALRARGISGLYIYGSYARDEARNDSDLDILVDFESGGNRDFMAYMAPFALLEDEFPGVEIGYSDRESIVAHYRPHIERSAVRVF